MARSGGSIETVADGLNGLTRWSDVLVDGVTVYWTDDTGVWKIRTNCATLPCTDTKVLFSSYGAANTIGFGLVYENPFPNFPSNTLAWVESTSIGQATSQYKIRQRTCSISCSTTTFHTAAPGWAIGPPVSDGANFFWTENYPYPDEGKVWRKGIHNGNTDPADEIVGGHRILRSRLAIANGKLYFKIDSSSQSAPGIYLVPLNTTAITRDLAADAWEVTQGIQNLANGATVIAYRTTYVRVYGKQFNGPNANIVDVELVGTRNGLPLPGSPLKPLNGARALRAGGSYYRASLNGGWYFLLPNSWVKGTVVLRAEVDPQQTYTDLNRDNNSLSATFTFVNQPPVCVWTVPVSTHTPLPSVRDPNFMAMVDGFEQRWPVRDVWIYRDTEPVEELQICFKWYLGFYPCFRPYELTDGASLTNGLSADRTKVLNSLQTRALLTFDPPLCTIHGAPTHFMGMVHPDAKTGNTLGYARVSTNQSWVKLPPHSPNPIPADWSEPGASSVMAQELAHNYGRKHVNCPVGDPDDIDSKYPYPSCYLDNTGPASYYGFDVRTQTPIPPYEASDFMSYKPPSWVSNYTWEALINKFAASAVTAAQGQAPLTGELVYIAGFVDQAITDGVLNYAYVLPAESLPPQTLAAAQATQSTQVQHDESQAVYTLRLLGADDALLHEETPTLASLDDHTGDSAPALFSALFSAPVDAVAKVLLLADTAVIDELTPGPGYPIVTIQQPVGGAVIDADLTIQWTSSDPDVADQLLFIVQYSYNGSHWHTLVNDFPNAADGNNTLALADLGSLQGSTGQTAVVRVIASDGYHTTIATSPNFSVPNRKPDVYIMSPSAGQSFPAALPVVLRGSATDAEDGGLDDAALAWKVDNIDVGTGASLVVDGLAPGTHLVTLTATDTTNNTARVSANFQVEPLSIPQTVVPVLDGFCEDDAYADGVTVLLNSYDAEKQARVRLLRTANDVWACFIDMKKGNDDPGAFAGLRVDVDNSRDALAQTTDVGLFAGEDGSVFTTMGDNVGGFTGPGPSGLQAQVSNDATSWRAELRIAGSVFGGLNHLIGLKLGHYSVTAAGDDYGWPASATNIVPNTWAPTALGNQPRLTSLEPYTTTAGGSAFTLDIKGSNFLNGTLVLWNKAPLETSFVDSGYLTATVKAEYISNAGTVTIETRSLAPANFESNGLSFVVLALAPIVTEVLPPSIAAGSATTLLIVSGANFTEDAQVLWNGVAVPTTFGNSGQLTAEVAAALLVDGQTAGIAVRNQTPQERISEPVAFEVTPNIVLFLPTILSPTQSTEEDCIPSAPGESDGVTDALTICHDQAVSGQVSQSDKWDVYKITATANRQFKAVMTGNAGDADLTLFPPGTSDLQNDPAAFWSTAADTSNESIEGTVLVDGDWYVAVNSYSGTTDYQLQVTLGELVEPPACMPDVAGDSDNISDARAICPGHPASGQVSQAEQWDVYKINFAENTAIDVTLTGTGGDADIWVYAPDATDVLVNDPVAVSANTGNEERIAGVIRTPGIWYIAVQSYEGSTEYTLRVISTFLSAVTTQAQSHSEVDQDAPFDPTLQTGAATGPNWPR